MSDDWFGSYREETWRAAMGNEIKEEMDDILAAKDAEIANAREVLTAYDELVDSLRAEIERLRCRVAELEADIPLKWQARQDEMQATIGELREALDQAEAALSIVEPRSDKAEYLRILGVVRAALGSPAPVAGSMLGETFER